MPEAKKKSNTGLMIGIGCAGLLFLTCAGGGGFAYWKYLQAKKAAQDFVKDLNSTPTPAPDGSAPSGDTTPAPADTAATEAPTAVAMATDAPTAEPTAEAATTAPEAATKAPAPKKTKPPKTQAPATK